ncbi:23S rRNA (cytidine1920-2'-O)/16S rRNA (cytidine1409-2'-O)-methyltransferase [Verrucomicrobium sp. GAS474]|uniref:TlyA family RNA methyltransferase n=1 Tax=Verrucomicrobium sp. GAS474 TaxID=1882831 RepID=UPI00087A1FBC|nr:TlyA family RNA methyltransferase [Verrucomicrobium sp. GAS474]SDU04482.1 23S rRNA (cytidine1920-2'-O)/16S rRNA (cytidine1409-2'-O)-methyltransferase [Verrucomicrobium sp. GAS474]
MKKVRLDQFLVERGLCESREKAQRAILAGEVWIGCHRGLKASQTVPPDAVVEVRGRDRYVGRGGHKLEGALAHFSIPTEGARCLDVGASTGGFTDCLLQHGAVRVVTIDVGTNQLHWKIRDDARVEAREGVNARGLTPADFPGDFPFDLAVGDLSFISLRLILPAVLPLLRPGGLACFLIKPQFEAGRGEVGKGGIVRDDAVRERVVTGLRAWAAETFPGVVDRGVVPSQLKGTDGNQEYLWALETGKNR